MSSTFQDLSLNYTIVSSTPPYTALLYGHDATLGPNVTIPQTASNGLNIFNVVDISNNAFKDFNTMTSVTFTTPSNVGSIGREGSITTGAFESCTSLTAVSIPNSVTWIGRISFENCTSLSTVSIPSSVTHIGVSTFRGCSSLTEVTIPGSVDAIYRLVFENCTSLTSATLPSSITSINSYAFRYCSILKTVNFSSLTSLNLIESEAFYQCYQLDPIIIPSSVTEIRNRAFEETNLSSLIIPSSVTNLGPGVFGSCTNLASVTFDAPCSVNNIDDNVFGITALTTITIPSSVTRIGFGTFFTCTSLASVNFDSPISLVSIDGEAFRNCTILGPQLTITSSVTEIGNLAFWRCTSLTSVYFDASNSTTLPILNGTCFDQLGGGGGTKTNKAYYYAGVLDSDGSPATNATFTAAGFASSQEINSTEPITCFKEDTKILTNKGYIPIQNLKKGHLVKTLEHDYLPIYMIGKKDIHHPAITERIQDQLYKCTKDEYPEIIEDLVLTGCHSILVDEFANEEQKEKTIEVNKIIYVTDRKYRLPACADHRASVYEHPGNYTIYHLALENNDYYMNYGIYANGLLVETCSKRYLKEVSNMTLID